CNTRHLQFTVVRTRSAGHFATIANTNLSRITRQLSELNGSAETLFQRKALSHYDRLQTCTLFSVTLNQLFAALILFDCASLGHINRPPYGCGYGRKGKLKARRSARASSSALAVVQTMRSMPQI